MKLRAALALSALVSSVAQAQPLPAVCTAPGPEPCLYTPTTTFTPGEVEFVLREKLFRRRMMAEIEPDYWVCPSLAPADSPLEVMQDGAQKVGGSIKPWAPSLSYGLIVKVGADFLPERSFHSRADGRLHGITSLAETADKLFATSIGGNAVIAIPVEG